MNCALNTLTCVSILFTLTHYVHAGEDLWVNFANETSERLPTPPNDPALSTEDDSEKSFAWGDLDNDGDVDVILVRRPAYAFGFRQNVLFMNEGTKEGHATNGVLIDRTLELASASDVPKDMGFLTPTSDRDVVVVDVNDDGWLDIVTACAWSQGEPKHIAYPRVYVNLGEKDGTWLGLQYEDARIPEMEPGQSPRFASVSSGDITGDGFADLYFTDFDNSESPFSQPDFDFNNRLLINDGTGHFTDETTLRLTEPMRISAYGAASDFGDVNGDGALDILKQSSNLSPLHIAVTYNDSRNEGFFNLYDVVYAFPMNGYFASLGELNNDGMLDIIVTDNNADRYLLNQGNGPDGAATFTQHTFPFTPGIEFGGNSIDADLNNDSFNDVLITDMDVDVPGCFRRMHIWRNNGEAPTVSFDEQEVIDFDMLFGTHDVAVLDINTDGWLDLIVGRCAATDVWINQPPPGDPANLDGDGVVGPFDLAQLLGAWGACNDPATCQADLDGDGSVGPADLAMLLGSWG